MGFFLTVEGIEGSGKSTLSRKLFEHLSASGHEVIHTREPGGTPTGQKIRELVLSSETGVLPRAELLLFAADRAQHVEELLRPALERGAVVISDRYTHSTLAYQGFGRGVPLPELHTINELATGGLEPDLVLILDIEPKKGLERARRRSTAAANDADTAGESWNRFEDAELAFHDRVRNGFLKLAQDPTGNILVLNADLKPDQILDQALKALDEALPSPLGMPPRPV